MGSCNIVLNHAAEYVGSSGTESRYRVSRQLFMMLNHAAEYLGSYDVCMMLNQTAE